MAKVLQIVDVYSNGHQLRLSDGRLVIQPHNGDSPKVGDEYKENGETVPVEKTIEEPNTVTFADEPNLLDRIASLEKRIYDLEVRLNHEVPAERQIPPIVPEQTNAVDTGTGTIEGQQGEHAEEAPAVE